MPRFLALCVLLTLIGCGGDNNPPSVSETSATTGLLADRIEFLETYVEFRRQYDKLEYDIFFQNNGGGPVPGPSDWDVRLVAQVPHEQLDGWISPDMKDGDPPKDLWHLNTANEIDVTQVSEWYIDRGRTVGIDRENSIVVYRNNTLGQ